MCIYSGASGNATNYWGSRRLRSLIALQRTATQTTSANIEMGGCCQFLGQGFPSPLCRLHCARVRQTCMLWGVWVCHTLLLVQLPL